MRAYEWWMMVVVLVLWQHRRRARLMVNTFHVFLFFSFLRHLPVRWCDANVFLSWSWRRMEIVDVGVLLSYFDSLFFCASVSLWARCVGYVLAFTFCGICRFEASPRVSVKIHQSIHFVTWKTNIRVLSGISNHSSAEVIHQTFATISFSRWFFLLPFSGGSWLNVLPSQMKHKWRNGREWKTLVAPMQRTKFALDLFVVRRRCLLLVANDLAAQRKSLQIDLLSDSAIRRCKFKSSIFSDFIRTCQPSA